MMTIKDLDFVRRVSKFGGKIRGVHELTNLQVAIACYRIKTVYTIKLKILEYENRNRYKKSKSTKRY